MKSRPTVLSCRRAAGSLFQACGPATRERAVSLLHLPEVSWDISVDTSAPVPKCPVSGAIAEVSSDTSAPVPKYFGAEVSWGRSVSSPSISVTDLTLYSSSSIFGIGQA